MTAHDCTFKHVSNVEPTEGGRAAAPSSGNTVGYLTGQLFGLPAGGGNGISTVPVRCRPPGIPSRNILDTAVTIRQLTAG